MMVLVLWDDGDGDGDGDGDEIHLGWEQLKEKEEAEEVVVLVDVMARGIRSWIGRHESFWQL